MNATDVMSSARAANAASRSGKRRAARGRDVSFRDREDVGQNDWRLLRLNLAKDRNGGIERVEL